MTLYGPDVASYQGDVNWAQVAKLPLQFSSKIHVNVETGCWEWTASRKPAGYAQCTVNRKVGYGHRRVYELLVGPIPEGLHLDHLCRVRHCVNPAHLEVVTQQVNCLRGVSPAAEAATRTQCSYGHAYTSESSYVNKYNKRVCRVCNRAKVTEYQRRGYYTREAKAARSARRRASRDSHDA